MLPRARGRIFTRRAGAGAAGPMSGAMPERSITRRGWTRRGQRAAWADGFEALEPRTLLSSTFSAQEVYLAELVNRARANPQAEAARLGLNLTSGLSIAEQQRIVPTFPLALSEQLMRAARAHSLDMGDRGFFDHVNPSGLWPTQRAQIQGFPGSAGENIGINYTGIDALYRGWMSSASERKNILSLHTSFDSTFYYDRIGPGFALGRTGAAYSNAYTTDFGATTNSARTAWLTGVAYADRDADAFYSIGEGLGGVRVDVFAGAAVAGSPVASFTTDDAGNYQLPLGAGTYSVRFTQTSTDKAATRQVTVGAFNAKQDVKQWELTAPVPAPPPPPPPPTDDFADAGQWSQAATIVLNPSAGATRTGVLGAASDSDLFTFVAGRAGSATLTLAASAGNLALRLRVYNAAQSLVGTGSLAGGVLSVGASLAQGSTYYVLVDSTGGPAGAAGSPTDYTLLMVGPPEPPPPPPPPTDDLPDAGDWSNAAAVGISVGTGNGAFSANLGAGDSDLARFTPTRSGVASVSVTPSGGDSGNQLLRVRVYDAARALLATGQASGQSSTLIVTVAQGQTYYLLVDAVGTTGGAASATGYSVLVQGPPEPPPADDHADQGQLDAATLLVLDAASGSGTLSGVLGSTGDTDVFRFVAVRSGATTLTALRSSGNQSIGVSVLTLDGQTIGVGPAVGVGAGMTVTLEAGRAYYVLVASRSAGGGGSPSGYVVSIAGPDLPLPLPPPPTPVSDLPASVLPAGEQRLATGLAGGKTVVSFVSATGGAMFAERGGDGVWRAVDVRARTAGPAMFGALRTFVDPRDGLTYVVGTSDMGVMVYKRSNGGAWSKRNLTRSMAGADSIARSLSVVTDPQGLTQIVGLNAAGQLVSFSHTGPRLAGGEWRFVFANVSRRDLGPAASPTIVGDLTAFYSRRTGSINIVGVDGEGRVMLFSRSGGAAATSARFTLRNVAAIAGGPTMAGAVTAMETAQGIIQITGTDQLGNLWAFTQRAGQRFRAQNVTLGVAGAPTLAAGSVASFVNQNVAFTAGLTSDGRVMLYRFENVNGGRWRVASVSGAIAGAPALVGPLQASFAGGAMLIAGRNALGEAVRLAFTPGGAWVAEGVSEILAP